MTTEKQPTSTRYTVEDLDGSRRFTIPIRKVWFAIASTGLGTVVWIAVSVVFAVPLLAILDSAQEPAGLAGGNQTVRVVIVVIALVGAGLWVFMGVIITRMFLWNVAGKEIVEVSSKSMALRRGAFGLGRTRVYRVEHIKNLRLSPPSLPPSLQGTVDIYGINLTLDWLVFDYEEETIKFARGVDEEEAKQLLDAIEKCL